MPKITQTEAEHRYGLRRDELHALPHQVGHAQTGFKRTYHLFDEGTVRTAAERTHGAQAVQEILAEAEDRRHWPTLTATQVKEEFPGISSDRLHALPHTDRTNPVNPHFAPMHIYQRADVEHLAAQLHTD